MYFARIPCVRFISFYLPRIFFFFFAAYCPITREQLTRRLRITVRNVDYLCHSDLSDRNVRRLVNPSTVVVWTNISVWLMDEHNGYMYNECRLTSVCPIVLYAGYVRQRLPTTSFVLDYFRYLKSVLKTSRVELHFI